MIFEYPIYPFESNAELQNLVQGSNQMDLFIVLDSESVTQKELLTKILSAVKIDIDKVLVLEMQKKAFIPTQFLQAQKVSKVISFGVKPEQLSVNAIVSNYEMIRLGERNFLFSDNLTEIAQQTVLKKQLWAALQIFFEVN